MSRIRHHRPLLAARDLVIDPESRASRRSLAAQRAWVTRRASVRVEVVDGPWKGKRLLFPRPRPEVFDGPEGVRYRVGRDDERYVAFVDTMDDTVPVVGWRAWRVVPCTDAVDETVESMRAAGASEAELEYHLRARGMLRWRLASGTNDLWPDDGPLAAVCRRTRQRPPRNFGEDPIEEPMHPGKGAPVWDCSCGIYFTTTYATLMTATCGGGDAIGLLAGWGKVIEHEDEGGLFAGYRAARAYPVAIVVNTARWARPNGKPMRQEDRIELLTLVNELRRAYRVPVGACSLYQVPEKMAGLVASPGCALSDQAMRGMPPDLRAALARREG